MLKKKLLFIRMHKSWPAVTNNGVIIVAILGMRLLMYVVCEGRYRIGSVSDPTVSPSQRLCASSTGDREPAEGLRPPVE